MEARAAIRAIGAEHALPVLLRLLKTDARQRTVHDLMLDVARQFNFYFKPDYQSDDPGEMAAAGFQALGTNAASAVPELAEIIRETNRAAVAFQCLSSIGPPARSVICHALTNSNPQIRNLAVGSVTSVVSNRDEALALVKDRLADDNSDVRLSAILVIGTQLRMQPESLTLLMEIVRRGDTNDAPIAATEIGNFDTNGVSAFETLSNAAYQTPHSPLAMASFRSMIQISPERTLPILTRRLHSIDPWLRFQALMLLIREYPKPENAIPAFEYAAQDPEEIIATRAENVLERLSPKEGEEKKAQNSK